MEVLIRAGSLIGANMVVTTLPINKAGLTDFS